MKDEREIQPGDLVRWVPGETTWIKKHGNGPFVVAKVGGDYIAVDTPIQKEVCFYRRRLELDAFRTAVRKRRHQ